MEMIRRIFTWVSRHRWLTAAVFITLVTSFFVISNYRRKTKGDLSPPIKRGTIIESVYGIGTVTAQTTYEFKPGGTMVLVENYVREGDRVEKNSELMKLDQMTVRAPFAGTVTFLPFKSGELVFSQVPMLRLVNLESRYLVVALEQQGLLRVRLRQMARISFDALREQFFPGRVDAIYSNEGKFYARLNIGALPAEVLPGMTADVAIEVGRRENTLIAPAAAIDQGRVLVKRGHRPIQEVPIELGIVDSEKIEIRSGEVKEGDRLVIRKKPAP